MRKQEISTADVIKFGDFVEKKSSEARYTHCWSCKKNINSLQFSLCDGCKGIKCSCNACFCSWG